MAPIGANRARYRERDGALRGVAVLATLLLAACSSPEERAADHLRKAQQLYDKGDFVAAAIEARNAVQVAPKNGEAHYLLALVAEQKQDPRAAFQHLVMAVDASPQLVPARVKLGNVYFASKDYDKAAEQAKAAAAIAPGDAEVHLLNARLLGHRKEQDAAIRELDAALTANPDLVEAIQLRAVIAASEDVNRGIDVLDQAIARLPGDKTRSLRQLRISLFARQQRKSDVEQGIRDLIRDFPDDPQLHQDLASFYVSEGRVDDAERVMRDLLKAMPGELKAQLGLVRFLAQMRSPQAAEQALASFIAEQPDQSELRLALGELYEASRQPDSALLAYEELARRAPKSVPGRTGRARLAALRMRRGEFDQAGAIVDSVLTEQPDHAEALLTRASLRLQDGKLEDALADMRSALRKDPANVAATLLMARAYAQRNERTLAKDAYRRLLEIDPGNAQAPAELAALEMRDGNIAGAEAALRARLKAAPDDMTAAAQLVELLIQRQAWPEAQAEARRVASLPGENGVGGMLVARVLLAEGRKPAAASILRQVLEKAPGSPLALSSLAAVLDDIGQSDEATRVIADQRNRRPDDLAMRLVEGSRAARLGNTGAAANIFSDIVASEPRAVAAWTALANLYPKDREYRIDVLRRGLAANPGNPDIGLALGTTYHEVGRNDDAIAHYQAMLKADPEARWAYNELAFLLLDYRNDPASHAEALRLARQLQGSSDPAVLDTVGWAYYRNKDYPRAVEFLNRAAQSAGEAPELRYHLGMAYLANGDTDSARESLLEATSGERNWPGYADAAAALARLEADPQVSAAP